MSYNGSGTFVINTAGQPVVSGTVISSTAFNALTADLATGLSTAITKDGQTTPTANIPMGNNKITGLAVGTAATDAANLSQVQSTTAKLITASGTDTVTGTLSPTLTAYAAGQMFYWIAAGANTGAVTLNIDSLGAKAVTRDGSTALAAGDIRSGEVVVVVYDGTRFQVVSQINSSGDATFANVSITSALNVGGVSTFTGLITANGGVSGALNGTVGATTPNTGSFTTLTTSSTVTLNGGTANGVLYLNGSKVATSGSALTFDGSRLITGYTASVGTAYQPNVQVKGSSASNYGAYGIISSNNELLGMMSVYSNGENSLWISSDPDNLRTGSRIVFAVDGTDRATLDSSGNLGIGTSSPGEKLNVIGGNNTTSTVNFTGGSNNDNATIASDYSLVFQVDANNTVGGRVFNWRYGGNGYEGGTSLMTLNASGNLGLGVTPSAWSPQKAMQISSYTALADNPQGGGGFGLSSNAYEYSSGAYKYLQSYYAALYRTYAGQHQWFTAPSGTAGNAITFTQAMTLDASGMLSVTRSGSAQAQIDQYESAQFRGDAVAYIRTSGGSVNAIFGCENGGATAFIGSYSNNPFIFRTNNTERARITSLGNFLVGTTNDAPGQGNVAGVSIRPANGAEFSQSSTWGVLVNRATNDGDLVLFYQDGTQEGSISVSGNTVSYNSFAGSHWSQLQDGSKPDILRGTVMESINELCVWPDENNERLPKSKISDTAGSKKVYGVFMAWDNDWTATNDMLITGVGAFICRVNGSVTVEEGDLLESNGDGTARVQADDIIRSSTIGKVTSTVKTHQYDDGSYCVPTVLYCG